MMNDSPENGQAANGRNRDPLRALYHEGFVENPAHHSFLVNRHSALLCIDMQYLDAARNEGLFAPGASPDMKPERYQYYFERLESMAIPNMQRLQATFRQRRLEVIHTRIQSLTRNGRDRSAGHRRLNLLAPPGSREAQFLPEVGPQGDEIVMNKTASGVFSSTNLHYVLKNIGTQALYICGVYTNECVETTVRDACDLGYLVTVVEDCCATVTPQLHEASLATLRDRYARVMSVDEVIHEIETSLRVPSER